MHANAAGHVLRRDDELEARVSGVADLEISCGAHHEDAGRRELAPQCKSLRHGCHAEPGRSRTECCTGDVGGAVAIGVRLHDRPQLRTFEGVQEGARVASERREVDGQLGAMHQARTRGSTSMRSLAMRPARWGASTEASCCAAAAAAAASCGSIFFARNAPTMPVRTSPVPAVARDGKAERDDEQPSAWSGHERVGSLEQHHAPEPLACLENAGETMRSDLFRLLAEQPCELAFVRCQDTWRGPLPGLELEERVCIDDGGEPGLGEHASNDLRRPGAAAEPRPDRDRARFLSKLERDVRGGRSDEAVGFG